MMCDGIYIRIPFPVFLRCFRSTQRFDDFLHLHREYQSICIPFDRIDQFPVLLPIQGFCHVICPLYGPSHPPMLHPHCDHRTVLVLLHSHVFIYDPFWCVRQLNSPFLVWNQPPPGYSTDICIIPLAFLLPLSFGSSLSMLSA